MTVDGSDGSVPTWRVNRAVRASDLDPSSTLIMFVLSDIADNATAEIPPQRTPSTRQLARETRLHESTVKRHRAALEEAGWLIITRPTAEQSRRGERLKYRLAIPADGVHRAHEARIQEIAQTIQDPTGVHSEPTPGSTVHPAPGFAVHPPLSSLWTPGGGTENHVGAQSTQGGRTVNPGWAHSAPPKEDVPDVPDVPEKPPAGAGDEDREQRFKIAEELTDSFWRTHGERSAQRRPAVRAVIITAVADNGVARNDAAAALHMLAQTGKQITADSLTAALARLRADEPARAAAPPAPRPPQRFCPVPAHAGMPLTADGLCRGCAVDAKVARDELDEPAAPSMRRAHPPLLPPQRIEARS